MSTGLRSLLAALLAWGLLAPAALAAGGESGDAPKQDEYYLEAKKNIDAGNYKMAILLLEQSVAENPDNPDAWNYLGYSLRKSGRLEEAIVKYQTALTLDPRHRGANEYLGELYLELGDLDKARERLDVLDDACFFGCEEYTTLKNAIAAYEAKAGS